MEKRVVTGFERSLTSNVNDIEHIESQSYNGYAVVHNLLPSERQSRYGRGAGLGHHANRPSPDAARNVSREHPEV